MDRINTEHKAEDLFGAGKHGWRNSNLGIGISATEFDSDWVNGVQEELLKMIESGGIVPDIAVRTQVYQAIMRLTGGHVTTVNFANSPFVLTADHAGLVIMDATAGNASATLPAANALASTPLKFHFVRSDATANTVTVTRAGADTFLGGSSSFSLIFQTDWRAIQSDTASVWATTSAFVPPGAVTGACRKFRAEALGVNNYNVVITAEEVVLKNSLGLSRVESAVNKTINANGVVGAPLSIMSARAASTFYYAWLWYNATAGLTATLDLSSTAPTAPTGYVAGDYKALTPHAVPTDASGNKYLMQIRTVGLKSRYVVLAGSNTTFVPICISGVHGDPTTAVWVAGSLVGLIPPTAISVSGHYSSASGTHIAAVNNTFGHYLSTVNPPNLASGHGVSNSMSFDFVLESMNLYWASNVASASIRVTGWEVSQ